MSAPSYDPDFEIVFSSGNVFRAGQRPAPGLYRQIDGPRSIEIGEGDPLPASFDGRVAFYRRIERLWSQIAEHSR